MEKIRQEKNNHKKKSVWSNFSISVLSLSFRLLFYAAVITLLYMGITGGYHFGYAVFGEKTRPGNGVEFEFTVEEGEGIFSIADRLHDRGLIKNEYIFIAQKYFYECEIIPGEYILNTTMTSKEVLDVFEAGQAEETEDTAE